MIDDVLISDEKDAWEALKHAVEKEISDTAKVTFKNWPIFDITIEGKDFNGTIPTRIMPPILDLQKEIFKVYCRAKYGTEDIRKLTHGEKEILELVVSIKPGSTKFITNLFCFLNEIVKNTNMNGNQAVLLLVGVALLITSSVAWKDWLILKERQHASDTTVQLSEQETKRLEIFTRALSEDHRLRESNEATSDFKSSISRKLKPTDQLKINEESIINGARAAEIIPLPKQEAREIRIDGEFIINEVRFPSEFGGKYRLSVTRLSDDINVMVDASPDTLTSEEVSILKDSGFGVKRVIMMINAKELRGNISSANLVTIASPNQ